MSRAWRAAVAKPRLWTRLDLSPASSVTVTVSDAVLRGAAARAAGGLQVLVLDECGELTQTARLEVVGANGGSLRELRCCFPDDAFLSPGCVEQLAAAAPQLQLLAADAAASASDALRMLRNAPPFGALQLRNLELGDEDATMAAVLAVAAAMPEHAPLRGLALSDVPWLDTPDLLEAFTDAARACRLQHLRLEGCAITPSCVPALAQLIHDSALMCLCIDNSAHGDDDGVQLLDDDTAARLAHAIADSRTLTRLALKGVKLWGDYTAARSMVAVFTGHPTICELSLAQNSPGVDGLFDADAAGFELGALVSANAPALRLLDISRSRLGDAGLAPLVDALPRNAHLRVLRCENTEMSATFARRRFLPAVRANASLRQLVTSDGRERNVGQ